MTTANEKIYSADFYDAQVQGSKESAQAILSILFRFYKPYSVVDVGCGRGAWLLAAESLGASVVRGFDGPWVTKDRLLSGSIEFRPVDMEGEFTVTEKCDLAVSVEVAEHLSAARASSFVRTLCNASDVVLFGAAIPCQGGENHVNEQRQSYWCRLFSEQGFVCIDLIRPAVWHEARVEPWYRQNTLLYVNESQEELIQHFRQSAVPPILDVVHPDIFERRVRYYRRLLKRPTARLIAGLIYGWMRGQITTRKS